MKVVLSRKGFDSSYGGIPSPIMPNGDLLPLPIPSKNDHVKYVDLFYQGKSYFDIISQLKTNTRIKENWYCHLDPDLKENVMERSMPWFPLFGQGTQAQNHLSNNGIGKGDLFLFWGWYRQTEYHGDVLRYVPDAPDLHLIWGYLMVKEVYDKTNVIPESFSYHPHGLIRSDTNAIYEGEKNKTGILRFSQKRVLTKEGMSRSKWDLPDIFRVVRMTYHKPSSFTENYFQSASRGQEFIIDENNEVEQWAMEIIK